MGDMRPTADYVLLVDKRQIQHSPGTIAPCSSRRGAAEWTLGRTRSSGTGTRREVGIGHDASALAVSLAASREAGDPDSPPRTLGAANVEEKLEEAQRALEVEHSRGVQLAFQIEVQPAEIPKQEAEHARTSALAVSVSKDQKGKKEKQEKKTLREELRQELHRALRELRLVRGRTPRGNVKKGKARLPTPSSTSGSAPASAPSSSSSSSAAR